MILMFASNLLFQDRHQDLHFLTDLFQAKVAPPHPVHHLKGLSRLPQVSSRQEQLAAMTGNLRLLRFVTSSATRASSSSHHLNNSASQKILTYSLLSSTNSRQVQGINVEDLDQVANANVFRVKKVAVRALNCGQASRRMEGS